MIRRWSTVGEAAAYEKGYIEGRADGLSELSYKTCANVVLEMWMDTVLTNNEYYRIMDKLAAYWRKKDEKEVGK